MRREHMFMFHVKHWHSGAGQGSRTELSGKARSGEFRRYIPAP
jgi:hypothetical protein